MLKRTNRLNNGLFLCLILSLNACGSSDDQAKKLQKQDTQTTRTDLTTETTANVNNNESFDENLNEKMEEQESPEKAEEISWNHLIPPDYNPNKAIGKYLEQLEDLKDDDQEAMVIYGKIQAELDNAPVNMSLDGKTIKMPGFIAPLENENGIISEFLLVPYFGACIHTPPPPMNQTVMVKVNKGQGIKSEESSAPVWITGKLRAIEERTDIGAAGYRIENAVIEAYDEDE